VSQLKTSGPIPKSPNTTDWDAELVYPFAISSGEKQDRASLVSQGTCKVIKIFVIFQLKKHLINPRSGLTLSYSIFKRVKNISKLLINLSRPSSCLNFTSAQPEQYRKKFTEKVKLTSKYGLDMLICERTIIIIISNLNFFKEISLSRMLVTLSSLFLLKV
jgi:hypothetical protein